MHHVAISCEVCPRRVDAGVRGRVDAEHEPRRPFRQPTETQGEAGGTGRDRRGGGAAEPGAPATHESRCCRRPAGRNHDRSGDQPLSVVAGDPDVRSVDVHRDDLRPGLDRDAGGSSLLAQGLHDPAPPVVDVDDAAQRRVQLQRRRIGRERRQVGAVGAHPHSGGSELTRRRIGHPAADPLLGADRRQTVIVPIGAEAPEESGQLRQRPWWRQPPDAPVDVESGSEERRSPARRHDPRLPQHRSAGRCREPCVRALVQLESAALGGGCPAARIAPRFEQVDGGPRASRRDRCGQPGEPAAHHCYVGLHRRCLHRSAPVVDVGRSPLARGLTNRDDRRSGNVTWPPDHVGMFGRSDIRE